MTNVFLYIPNLIGYLRIFLTGLALKTGTKLNNGTIDNYDVFLLYYSVSMGLDALDGIAARRLRQSSIFGVFLDMLTDRITTLVLFFLIYSNIARTFEISGMSIVFCAILDYISHWLQTVCASQAIFEQDSNHKGSLKSSALLKLYYRKPILFLTCVGAEAFLLCIYYLSNPYNLSIIPSSLMEGICIVSFPLFVFKQITNVEAIRGCSVFLVDIDGKKKA